MNLFDQIKNEKWVKIPNYDNYYINNKGQVIRVYINTITKLEHCKKSVSLNKNGKIESRWIMTLMRELFPKEEWDKSLRGFVEDLEGEIWKDIPNFDSMYQISNKGRLKTFYCDKERIRIPKTKSRGYKEIGLSGKLYPKPKHIMIHRLVAEAFIPNPENKPFVNHIDCNTSNNCVENLEWVTHQENMNHAVLNDRMFKVYNNEKKTHENSKLDEEKVRLIRKLYYEDKLGQITIAKMLNVSKNAISGVVTWRTWFYVDPDKKEYYKSIKATKHKNGEE